MIPKKALSGERDLTDYSVAMRMSWASCREATRIEGIACCLLGIFDVNMPLIYGEGTKSFQRLQEEIVKRNNDLSIFAWNINPSQGFEQHRAIGLFASSPANFRGSSAIKPFIDDFMNFSVTNKGLLVSGDVPLRIGTVTARDGSHVVRYLIVLGKSTKGGGIYLRKIGPKLFYRDGRVPLAGFGENEIDQIRTIDATDYYILIDPVAAITTLTTFRHLALFVPPDDRFRLTDLAPENLWDASDRVFLRPKPYPWTRYPIVLAMAFRGLLAGDWVDIFVLCDYTQDTPTCRIGKRGQYRRLEEILYEGGNKDESLHWAGLKTKALEDGLHLLKSSLDVNVGQSAFRVSVSVEKKVVDSVAGGEFFCLAFNVSRS